MTRSIFKLDDGCTVAVKRLKDANPCVKKEFECFEERLPCNQVPISNNICYLVVEKKCEF